MIRLGGRLLVAHHPRKAYSEQRTFARAAKRRRFNGPGLAIRWSAGTPIRQYGSPSSNTEAGSPPAIRSSFSGWAKSRSFFHMIRSPLPNPAKWNALVHPELVLLSRRQDRSPRSVLNQEARTPFAEIIILAAYNMISESSAPRVMTPRRLFLRQSSSMTAWSLPPSVQFHSFATQAHDIKMFCLLCRQPS